MLKIMLLIILSPLAILCGIASTAIIYAIVNYRYDNRLYKSNKR